MRHIFISASILALAGCGFTGADHEDQSSETAADMTANSTTENLADSMASNDDAGAITAATDIDDVEERPIMQVQVVLDRNGFGPGVIDGKMGLSTENALRGYQEAKSIEISGKLDKATKDSLKEWQDIPATRVVRIPQNWGTIEFKKVPDGAPEQAKMKRLGYNSLDEKLAERFHTTLEVLKQLNPNGQPAGSSSQNAPNPAATPPPDIETSKDKEPSQFVAGQLIRVPNIGADRIAPKAIADKGWQNTLAALGVGSDQPSVARIVVSKSGGTLKAFDKSDKLVALFTVTTGSENDPLPLGEWQVNGVAHNPPFAYNPELFWDVADDKEKQQLPPGPNGPVGVVWIDLTKEHYGIHGTPEPQTIGRAQSHGCVRLTNWDAARLAGMVSGTTKVLFEA